jgi:hypothetical protein
MSAGGCLVATVSEQLAECRENFRRSETQRDTLQSEVSALKQSRIQLYLSFGTGVFFMLILLTLAISISQPTIWQYTLFRTILSLAAGGIAALLPGDFEFKFKNIVRATGALGVFVFVFMQNPAQIAGVPEPNPTDSFRFKVLSGRADGPYLSCFSLPYNDVKALATKAKVFNTVAEFMSRYQSTQIVLTDYEMYRSIDERIVQRDGEISSSSNTGLILIDKAVFAKLEPHIAFTMANTTQCR